MGLLDSLFDPSSYNGQGGLLSRLLPSLGNYQSPGFPQQEQQNPIAIGNSYQMPRLGNPDQFQPQQAMTPPNAMPTQGQLPVPQSPGVGERLMAGFQNFANAGGPLPAIAGAINGLATGNSQANQTAQFLIGKGFDPNLARTVVSDPALLRAVLPNVMGLNGKTDDIKEFEYAKQEDPSLTFQKFMQQKKAVSGEYSLNPVFGTDEKGNTILMQTGKSGEAIRTKLPEGVKVSSGIEKVDLGTHWALYDRKSGVPLGTQPKDLQGKEAAEERGKVQGQAQAALPGAITDAENTKKKIDQLLANEGLDSIVGPLDQFRPSWTLGEKGNDALARYNQLKGQAFLQAYGLLRGGGAITDIEGKKAESAMARLDRAQSEADFRSALKDFRDAIDSGVAKLKDRAGGSTAPTASPSNDLKAKYGLD